MIYTKSQLSQGLVTVPVEIDSEIDSQCCWSTVVKKTSKPSSGLHVKQSSLVVSAKKQPKSIIDSCITAVVER